MTALYQLVGAYRELEGLADSEEVDSVALHNTLEALSGDIEDKAKAVGMFIGNMESDAAAIHEAAKSMKLRADRLERRAVAVRDYLLFNMKAAGITRIECPYFVLQVKKNPPRVVIDNQDAIPPGLMVQPEPPPPHADKKAILEILKDGTPVPGAHMEQGERLDIK
jgi:Siphovirus Gp157